MDSIATTGLGLIYPMVDTPELYTSIAMHPTSDIEQVLETIKYLPVFAAYIDVDMRDGSNIVFTYDGDDYISYTTNNRARGWRKDQVDALWERVNGRVIKW